MRLMKRASLAAVAALALGAGMFAAAPAYAVPVTTVIDGITYEADDSDIGAGATATGFDGSTTTVTIPDTVEIAGTEYDVVEIGYAAFRYSHLTDLTLGTSVETITEYAFDNNDLASVDIPDSVTTILGFAFSNNLLTTVTLGSSVTKIGGVAFGSSIGDRLVSVEFTGAAPTVNSAGGLAETFDTGNTVLVLTYPWAYDASNVVDGFTTPEWNGYPTEAIGDDDEPAEYLSITKTVDASFVRVYGWQLEKTGTVGEITVGDNEASAEVDFTVTATPDGYLDSYYVLSGQLTITNEIIEPMSVTVTDVPDIGVDSTCAIFNSVGEQANDLHLGASETVVLDYYCSFEGTPSDGTNTATVSWGDIASASVTEDVVFTQRDTSFETITVGDDHADPDNGFSELGTATWNHDHLPFVYDYTLTAGNLPIGECTTLTNTAAIYEMEFSTDATVEICPEAAVITPDPTHTPTPTPTPAEIARTGVSLDGGFIGIATPLLLAGGLTMLSTRRQRTTKEQ